MQTSFIETKLGDQSCFLDIQENNKLVREGYKQRDNHVQRDYHKSNTLPAIMIDANPISEDEIHANWHHSTFTHINDQQNDLGKQDQDGDLAPYFNAPQYSMSLFKKQQPFLSTIPRQRLENLLKSDNYSEISCLKELPNRLILKAFSKDMSQYVVLDISKGVRQDYEFMKSEQEKVRKINTNQYIINFYKIFYYEELFVYVIVLENYEKSLEQEIEELRRKKLCFGQIKGYSLFFQLAFAVTELSSFNITHNNINPSNVLKLKNGNYKLGGIGTYKSITKETLQLEDSKFNLRYFSPELLESAYNPLVEFTNKTDVYSISAIILDIFTEMKYSEFEYQSSFNNSNSYFSGSSTPQIKKNQYSTTSSPQHSPIKLQPSSSTKIPATQYSPSKSNIEQHQFLIVFNFFKKSLLTNSQAKRQYSYEMIPLLLKYLKPSFQIYKEIMKLIDICLQTPILDNQSNANFIMKNKLAMSNLKLDIIKNNYDGLHSHLEVAKAYSENGKVHEIYGVFKKGLEDYLESLKLYEQIKAPNSDEIIEVLRNIAQNYQNIQDYENYYLYSMKCLEIVESLYPGNHTSKSLSLIQVSWSFYFLKKGEQALEYALKALNMRKALFNNNTCISLVSSLDTVGAAYQLLGKHEEALQYFLESLNCLKSIYKGSSPEIAAAFNNIGVVYEEMKDFQQAYSYFQQASSTYHKLFGNYHSLLLISKKGIQRSLIHLNKEQELQQIQNEIQDMEQYLENQNK